jgi:hypothetical protein
MTSLRTHAEQHNTDLYRDYKKDRKVGEGAYAVVYLGTTTASFRTSFLFYASFRMHCLLRRSMNAWPKALL